MKFEKNNIYHIYNRGNNKQLIFLTNENYLFFLRKVRKEFAPYCNILAYCLMPNHFHLMIYYSSSDDLIHQTTWSDKINGDGMQILTRKIGTLLSSYTRAINKEQNRTGSLFQQKTKAKVISEKENYIETCFHYIHQNPLRAKLVNKIEDWEYSSFKDYVGLRKGTLINIICCKQLLNIPMDEKELYEESYQVISNVEYDKLY